MGAVVQHGVVFGFVADLLRLAQKQRILTALEGLVELARHARRTVERAVPPNAKASAALGLGCPGPAALRLGMRPGPRSPRPRSPRSPSAA